MLTESEKPTESEKNINKGNAILRKHSDEQKCSIVFDAIKKCILSENENVEHIILKGDDNIFVLNDCKNYETFSNELLKKHNVRNIHRINKSFLPNEYYGIGIMRYPKINMNFIGIANIHDIVTK